MKRGLNERRGAMSLYDYKESQIIEARNYPFYALIMAAIRQADDDNIEKLREAFPEVWDELKRRYNAPGGLIREEVSDEKV